MTPKWAIWPVLLLLAALLVGCGTDNKDDPLKPPHLSRDPQVRVTRAPTELAAAPNLTEEPDMTPTVEQANVVQQPFAGPTLDEEQYLMDEIEALLSKIDRKLSQTDLNP